MLKACIAHLQTICGALRCHSTVAENPFSNRYPRWSGETERGTPPNRFQIFPRGHRLCTSMRFDRSVGPANLDLFTVKIAWKQDIFFLLMLSIQDRYKRTCFAGTLANSDKDNSTRGGLSVCRTRDWARDNCDNHLCSENTWIHSCCCPHISIFQISKIWNMLLSLFWTLFTLQSRNHPQ